jgi:acyl-CoA-binding protein
MSDLEVQFKELVEKVRDGSVNFTPTQEQKLQLYALFKQVEEGDVTGEKPGMGDFVNRMKYMAREKIKGMSRDDAMRRYIDIVSGK